MLHLHYNNPRYYNSSQPSRKSKSSGHYLSSTKDPSYPSSKTKTSQWLQFVWPFYKHKPFLNNRKNTIFMNWLIWQLERWEVLKLSDARGSNSNLSLYLLKHTKDPFELMIKVDKIVQTVNFEGMDGLKLQQVLKNTISYSMWNPKSSIHMTPQNPDQLLIT